MELPTRRKKGLRAMTARKAFLFSLFLLMSLFGFAAPARAELTTANTVDKLIQQFQSASHSWESVIMGEAKWLFGVLALISLVLTFGLIVARGTEMGEVVAALVRWTLFTGIAWWALTNGPTFSHAIVTSFFKMGGQAAGVGNAFSPTMFLDVSFKLYQKILAQEHWYNLGQSIGAELVGILIVLCACWMTCNVVLALCSSWVFASAGVIFVAFGACSFWRDIAINFYRTVLAVAAKVMVMVLVMGIGYQFLQGAASSLTVSPNGGELVVFLAASAVLAVLSHSLPNQVASVVGGHGSHGIGNLGLGTGVAAAAAIGATALRGLGLTGKAADESLKALEKAANAAENLGQKDKNPGSNGNGNQSRNNANRQRTPANRP
jgi:type IV secretion system protein TrbL